MQSKIRRWFENLKLPKKMALVYLSSTSIFLTISIVVINLSVNIYSEKLYEKSLQELDYFTQQVNDSLTKVENQSYILAMDTEIQTLLSEMATLPNPSWEYLQMMSQLRFLLQSELNPDSIVKNIQYTDNHQITMEEGIPCGDIPNHLYEDFLNRMHDSRGAYVFQPPVKEYPYLLVGRDVRNRLDMSLDYLGSLIFICDMTDVIREYGDNLESDYATLFVYSKEGMIYQDANMDLQLPTFTDGQGYKIIQYKNEKYFMCFQQSAATGWMYVNLFPYSDIYGQIVNVQQLMIGCFFVVFIVIIVLMNKITHIITKPLEQLTESMRIVETGDFQRAKERLDNKQRNDEVGLLTQEFQLMLDKIDVLIYENYEKQLLLQDTKYRMLQAQINPHFLYNTLNALNWMVKAERNVEAGKMIVELGNLLRSSFTNDPYATIEEEIGMVESYIAIQKIRYQKRAEFIVEKEENLGSYIVPRMILQPLVENCIYYGVDKVLEVCTISVRVFNEEQVIRIEVEDNGSGMSDEELTAVRNFTITPKGHGIGLKNIYERLQITYENSDFCIESQWGKGTKILIRIPKLVRGDQNV